MRVYMCEAYVAKSCGIGNRQHIILYPDGKRTSFWRMRYPLAVFPDILVIWVESVQHVRKLEAGNLRRRLGLKAGIHLKYAAATF